LDESLEQFFNANDWALEREDRESECLCYGQVALTYYELGDFKNALTYFGVIFSKIANIPEMPKSQPDDEKLQIGT
jgi:hypothetical protein